jgi:integrase/recombinase XerD
MRKEADLGGSIGLREFADEYLKWSATQKPRWAQTEKSILNRAIPFFENLGVRTLAGLSTYHVEQLKVKLREDGLSADPKKPKPSSKATVNRYCQTLRAMYYRAIDWGRHDGQNPLRKVKMFRERPEIRPLSHADFAKIEKAAREISKDSHSPMQKVFHDLVILIANTGLRKTEALGLRWRLVEEDSIVVHGKGDKRRIVPLNDAARKVVQAQPRTTSDYVFDVPNRYQSKNLSRTFDRVEKLSGVPFHMHLLRHYFATTLLERGADIVTVAEILGHSSTMTALLYSHSNPDRKKQAVALMGKKRPIDTKHRHRGSDVSRKKKH